jgi:hypothetical protein
VVARRASVLLVVAWGLSACGASSSGNPIEGIGAVAIAADRAAKEEGEDVLAWNVEVDTAVVRWRECSEETVCTRAVRAARVGDLRGIATVGFAKVEGADGQPQTVEVKRLRFGPPPPNRPTGATEGLARMREAAPGP